MGETLNDIRLRQALRDITGFRARIHQLEDRVRELEEALDKIGNWKAGYTLHDDGMAMEFAERTALAALRTDHQGGNE